MKKDLDKAIIHKELDLIQGIINRMAKNSFQVKAWLMAILGAIVAFEKDALLVNGDNQEATIMVNAFLIVIIICFWLLDAFFLSVEKLYIEVYKWVVEYRNQTNKYLYDLNTFTREIDGVEKRLILANNSIWNSMMSSTLILFYLGPFIFTLLLLIYNYLK